jgi:uncharacterized protein YutE (UPF0331/DUF86 family)
MDKLLEEILIEKDYIEETLDVLREALNRSEKTVVELSAIGASLHHCYNGMENILKRILKFHNISTPSSASSHKDLLDIAIQEKLISEDISDKLDKFRGFRHFFVHGYGVLLNEEELQPLVDELPDVWVQFVRGAPGNRRSYRASPSKCYEKS